MKGILDKYDKVDSGWIVRYKVDKDNLIVYQHVMLHPNQVNYAELDKEVEFRIESCPNLQNSSEWEDMAIIDTGEAKRISEIMEKFKDKVMFPKMVERAKESLKGVKIPEPDDFCHYSGLPSPTAYVSNGNSWEDILFDFIDFYPFALPNELIDWLQANYEVPKKKNNEG
jgi:hypothetical protein